MTAAYGTGYRQRTYQRDRYGNLIEFYCWGARGNVDCRVNDQHHLRHSHPEYVPARHLSSPAS